MLLAPGQASPNAPTASLPVPSSAGDVAPTKNGNPDDLAVEPLAESGASPASAGPIPTQFIAKMYTEALGRIPDQGGWTGAVGHYAAYGCNQTTLRDLGRVVYLSGEYSGLGYDNAAKVLTLYRGILNREPDGFGFPIHVADLNAGVPFADKVDFFFGTGEFAGLVESICSGGSYGWGTTPVLSGHGGYNEISQADLENRLATQNPVLLPQKTVVRLTRALTIPPGRILATEGYPNPNRYAVMARLVRDFLGDVLVKVSSGASLQNIAVDGSRSRLGYNFHSSGVVMLGGSDSYVYSTLMANSNGWTNLFLQGRSEGAYCNSAYVGYNLITAYSSVYAPNLWVDGISNACENATVAGNQIVDTTDLAIVVFEARANGPVPAAPQVSLVYYNTVLSAGNSAIGAFGADPRLGAGLTHDFANYATGDRMWIFYNTFWSGPNTAYRMGMAVGTRAWWGANASMGRGAAFYANNTGSLTVRVNTGIGVSGMLDTYVDQNFDIPNYSQVQIVPISSCPRYPVWVDWRYASGYVQSPHWNVPVDGPLYLSTWTCVRSSFSLSGEPQATAVACGSPPRSRFKTRSRRLQPAATPQAEACGYEF